jgi:hypothetical protein
MTGMQDGVDNAWEYDPRRVMQASFASEGNMEDALENTHTIPTL